MTDDLRSTIAQAYQYLGSHGAEIPLDIHNRARRLGAVKVSGDFASLNAEYHDTITAAMTTYFEGGIITGPRNRFRQASVSAFYDMFYLGFADSGGGVPDTDAIAWLDARIAQELGYIDVLMGQIKLLKKDDEFDFFSWVTAKADGYTATLAGIYNAAKMFAEKGKLLTWRLGNTEKHCDTCRELNGNRHRASWYINRNYIPRQPGAYMLCGGYYCDCSLVDGNGNEVTI